MLSLYQRIPPIFRIPLRYAMIGGPLGALLVIVLYYIDRHPFLVPVFFDFRIMLFAVFLFFALKELRQFYFKGVLFFWEGMLASLVFISGFAVLASLLIWAFAASVNDFVARYIELFVAQARTFPPEVIERIGREAYESNLAAIPLTTPFDLAFLYFWQCLGIGLFVSIIISVILRRQPQPQ